MYCVRKFVSLSINVTNLAKMIIATGLATIPIHQIQVWHFTQSPILQVLGGLLMGGVIYVMTLLYLGVFPIKTIESIPWIGPLLARTLLRMPFVS
jgi:stage V sporulation protein B